jgi:hypothetical protein
MSACERSRVKPDVHPPPILAPSLTPPRWRGEGCERGSPPRGARQHQARSIQPTRRRRFARRSEDRRGLFRTASTGAGMPHHCDRDQRVANRVHQKPGRALLPADPLAVIDCQETFEAAGAQHFTNSTFEIVLITRSCRYCWPTYLFKRSDLFLEGTNNILEAPVADKSNMFYAD